MAKIYNPQNHSLEVKTLNGIIYIPFTDVVMIKGDTRLADVYYKNKADKYDVCKHLDLLKTLEVQLPPTFFKPHRNNIVNPSYILGFESLNRKLKGFLNELVKENLIVCKTKDWSFKISPDKQEEFKKIMRTFK